MILGWKRAVGLVNFSARVALIRKVPDNQSLLKLDMTIDFISHTLARSAVRACYRYNI